MAVAIESISPSSGDATDRFLVRRGAGPADHTIQLLTPASVKALLSISTADVSGLAAVATSGAYGDLTGIPSTFAPSAHTHPASQISDATTAGRNMLTAADVAAQTALLDLFTTALKGLVPASGGGTTNFLRADGNWAAPPGGGGGSVLSGDATLTLSTNKYEHEETVAAVGVTGSNRISVWLDPATDDDENVPEMTDIIALAAAPGTDQITVTAAFSIPHHGPLKIQWSAL
jgi:hypothetical protein